MSSILSTVLSEFSESEYAMLVSKASEPGKIINGKTEIRKCLKEHPQPNIINVRINGLKKYEIKKYPKFIEYSSEYVIKNIRHVLRVYRKRVLLHKEYELGIAEIDSYFMDDAKTPAYPCDIKTSEALQMAYAISRRWLRSYYDMSEVFPDIAKYPEFYAMLDDVEDYGISQLELLESNFRKKIKEFRRPDSKYPCANFDFVQYKLDTKILDKKPEIFYRITISLLCAICTSLFPGCKYRIFRTDTERILILIYDIQKLMLESDLYEYLFDISKHRVKNMMLNPKRIPTLRLLEKTADFGTVPMSMLVKTMNSVFCKSRVMELRKTMKKEQNERIDPMFELD